MSFRNDPLYEDKNLRGWFSIALYMPKFLCNIGSLLRTATIFKAANVFTIGEERYKRQRSDVVHSELHLPIIHHETFESFFDHLPNCCDPVAIERSDMARDLMTMASPPRPCFIFGPEDGSLPDWVIKRCRYRAMLPGFPSLNLACCGSIVMYDFLSKSLKPKTFHKEDVYGKG